MQKYALLFLAPLFLSMGCSSTGSNRGPADEGSEPATSQCRLYFEKVTLTTSANECLVRARVSALRNTNGTWISGIKGSLDPAPLEAAVQTCLGFSVERAPQPEYGSASADGALLVPTGIQCTGWVSESFQSVQ